METDDFELQSSDEGNKTRRIVENTQDESTVVAVTDSDENESTCKCIESVSTFCSNGMFNCKGLCGLVGFCDIGDLFSGKTVKVCLYILIIFYGANVCLPLVDEVTDVLAAYYYFRSKDWIFGGLTLSLAFLPFMFAMLRKQSCEAFYQLPGVHIVRNFQTCLKSQNLKLITANLECEKEKAEDCEEKEKLDLQIDYFNDKLRNLSSDSQVDKSYQAILESGLQFLLQTTINYYQFGEFGWLVWLKVSSPLTKFQILSSFVSVIVTLTKMLFDLPVQVGNKMVKRRDYKSCRSTVETGWKYYRGKLAYVASASIIPLLVIGSSLLATTLRDQMFGKHFNMFSWKMATCSLLAEIFFLGTCLHCYSCVNIRLKRGRLHEKAKECLILSGFAGLIFPSVICEFEENLVFVSGFFAAVCGIITPLVMTILVHVLDESSIDPKIFKDTNQARNQTFTEEGHWSQFQNDMEKQLVWSCCVSLFTIAFFFFCNSIKGLYLHENWQYATQSKNISKVKDSMISMCPKSFGGLVNCSAFTFHFIQKCKYGWCMGYLPNLGMTQLVYATIVGFHECVDFLLDHENSFFVSKRSKEHTPQNAYVLLTEDNAEIFINDDENLNEVKEKIMELNTLSGKDLQLKLKALIRRNRYFSKSALIIASEKKDIEMIKILIMKLPAHLLSQTDCDGKSGFIYSCHNNQNDIESTRQAVRMYLESNRNIDLNVRDNEGKTGFDYLPTELHQELQTEFPHYFAPELKN